MACKVIYAQSPIELELAYRCHHDCYVAAGYLEPRFSGMYQDRFSAVADYYLVCVDGAGDTDQPTRQIAGVVRLIHQHPMPMFIDFELSRLAQVRLFDTEPAEFMEISALSWRPGMDEILPHLYRAIWQGAQRRQRHWLIASLDECLLARIRADGWPFRVGGESRFYMGSTTTPVYFQTEQIAAALPATNPTLWAIMQQPLDQAVCL